MIPKCFYCFIRIKHFEEDIVSINLHKKKLKTEFISFEGGNVRLVQMGVALQHLSHVISEVVPGAPLVFCGDFNSSPNSGNSTPERPTIAAPVSASIHFVFCLQGTFV